MGVTEFSSVFQVESYDTDEIFSRSSVKRVYKQCGIFIHSFTIMCSDLTFIRRSMTAKVPVKGTIKSAGFDLFVDAGDSNEAIHVKPFSCKLISTGISVKFPSGYYGKIEARSGSAVKQPLMILAGVIDEDYMGEIKICVYNLNPQNDFVVKHGDCFAQLILIPYYSSSLWLESICVNDERTDFQASPILPPEHKRFKRLRSRECGGFGSTDN